MPRLTRRWLLRASTIVVLALCLALSVAALTARPAEAKKKRFIEKVVDYMWTEERSFFMDTFKARVVPYYPQVGWKTRFTLRIKRTREGIGYGEVRPLRVEVELTPKKGMSKTLVLEKPGSSSEFIHRFKRGGQYTAKFTTYYTEDETYTIKIPFYVNSE